MQSNQPATNPAVMIAVVCAVISLVQACGPTVAEPSADVLDGVVPGLSAEQNRRHIMGDLSFNDEVFTSANGLGPLFVASSCGSCHPGDGRGHPSTALIRFGQSAPGENVFLGKGGPQLQQHAIPGFMAETLPPGVSSATFLAPSATGLGFLDAVTDAAILEYADEHDANGDGISGRPNRVRIPDYVVLREGADVAGGLVIGRFGRKASAYNLQQQTAVAYNQDIGITSELEPIDAHTNLRADPEVSLATINNVVFYLQTLKVPPRRNTSATDVIEGEALFTAIGCANCHRPSMTTGASAITSLAYKTIHPYSDLLLHDMGPELDDGYTEHQATTAEWRTTPLWGIGLSTSAQGGRMFLMHDGRAQSINEAIEFHGGEGAKAREQFRALPAHQKQQLVTFLESL